MKSEPAPPPSGPAVQVRGLVKRYGDRTAVDGLDLCMGAGAVTAVLGPNGAGKTTTIETCEGTAVRMRGRSGSSASTPSPTRRGCAPGSA